MLDSSKLISTQIEKMIPQFIRMEYPAFVEFLKAYYMWMESEGAPYQFISNALNYSDVDRTSLELLDKFGQNFLQPLPDSVYEENNIATLVKNIEQYYSARGSEKAFQFMFRLFEYKDDADNELEFYYPSYDMLRVSDGKWVQEKSLKIIDPPVDVMDWEAGQCTGRDSGAVAVIDEIKLYETTSGESVAEIYLLEYDVLHTPESFICGEVIDIITLSGIAYEASTEKVFSAVNITDSGKWNIPEQRVHIINDGDGEDARIVVDYTGKGTCTGFSIVSGGADYAVGDRVYTVQSDEDFGSGAYGKVESIDGTGAITEITMIFGGHDYRYAQKVMIDSISGSGAIVFMESDDIGTVQTLEFRDFGLGYEITDTLLYFNVSMRIHSVTKDFFIGESVIGQTTGTTGKIEYWNKETGVISVWVTAPTPDSNFDDDETIVGQTYGSEAIIYDQNQALGELSEGCLCSYKGRYINLDGHISSLKYIQDSYFYQMFSYMLKTTEDKEDWADIVKNSHPAGTIGFGYRDAISQYSNESYGGFISPSLDSTEFYKFRWAGLGYHGGYIRDEGNTQIKQYADVVIDEVSNTGVVGVINNDGTLVGALDKTDYTFGSEITIEEITP